MIPTKGIHLDIPFEEYHSWEALNSGALRKILRSPAHYKRELDSPQKVTEDMRLGLAIHAAVLEGERFKDQYVVGPSGDKRTKDVKDQWAVLKSKFGDDKVLSVDQYEVCNEVLHNLTGHPVTATVLYGPDVLKEVSFVWEQDGVLCKGRADFINQKSGIVGDLKSTQDARQKKFRWIAEDRGYFVQMAFYQMGLAANGMDLPRAFIVAVENDLPCGVQVYCVSEGALSLAGVKVDEGVFRYKKAMETGEWKGYDELIQILGGSQD